LILVSATSNSTIEFLYYVILSSGFFLLKLPFSINIFESSVLSLVVAAFIEYLSLNNFDGDLDGFLGYFYGEY